MKAGTTCLERMWCGALLAGGPISSMSTAHWRTRGRCTTILAKSLNCWKRADEGQANPKGKIQVCCEGRGRLAQGGEGRPPNRPHARCTDLRLGKRKGCCAEALALKHRHFRARHLAGQPYAGNVPSSDWVCQDCALVGEPGNRAGKRCKE